MGSSSKMQMLRATKEIERERVQKRDTKQCSGPPPFNSVQIPLLHRLSTKAYRYEFGLPIRFLDMPIFNLTLEDTSPMIRYSANWRAGTSDDPSLDEYSEKTFMLTQKQGESLDFTYYGTAVAIFGAFRYNHGKYQAQLNGGQVFSGTGLADPAAFGQVLYTTNATLGLHSLTVVNVEDASLDVDYVTFQTSVGQDGEQLIVNTFEDNHPSFVYSPASAWSTSPAQVNWFSGSSGHSTTQPSAMAQFTFEVSSQQPIGDAIALYGPVGPSGGEYSVQVDNSNSSTFMAYNAFFKPKEVLVYVGNLGPGTHTLQMQLTSTSLGELAIDYAEVYTTPSLGGRFLGTAASSLNVGDQVVQETKIPTGIIIGLTISSVLAVATSLLCVYLLFVLRRDNKYTRNTWQPFIPHIVKPESFEMTQGPEGSPTATFINPIAANKRATNRTDMSSRLGAFPSLGRYMSRVYSARVVSGVGGGISAVGTQGEPRRGVANPPLYTETDGSESHIDSGFVL
ncbi:hypothetical protein D9613_000208 [Agrocybe pediades]|uniref:Transmembrane protein n=1 Tax=Agrocybe pediades TaxID=84607 RepID=A0A8H4R161_9AGAR|nr:hypothetical protein D9613_000208 [Agrocybe pediades]